MDSRYLQNFVVVVELGSIAEAARRLDMTSATLAQRLRTLEAAVGSRLIVRSGRTVKPTVAGLRIVDRARGILREIRDLKSAASDTDLPAGPLRLGATPTALSGILPEILKEWVQRYPHIHIYIEPASTNVLYGRVLDERLDAAVLVHPVFVLPKTCGWQGLRQEPLILLTPASMPVIDPLETIAREPFILHDRRVIAGRLADDYLHRHGVRPHVRFELEGIENIAKLVEEGLGVSVLPDWPVLGPFPAGLKKWPLPSPCPSRRVGVMWLRSSGRTALVKILVEIARAHFPAG
ncbi:MAG: LysR family transcriptional regulator [Burkholderiaceae bacterium]